MGEHECSSHCFSIECIEGAEASTQSGNILAQQRIIKLADINGVALFVWRCEIREGIAGSGSELACMSTSENIDVVARYARSNNPLLLRIKVESPMDRGANLKWLSCYPSEDEVLFPPLTYLKPLFKQKILNMEEGQVVTLKAVFPS